MLIWQLNVFLNLKLNPFFNIQLNSFGNCAEVLSDNFATEKIRSAIETKQFKQPLIFPKLLSRFSWGKDCKLLQCQKLWRAEYKQTATSFIHKHEHISIFKGIRIIWHRWNTILQQTNRKERSVLDFTQHNDNYPMKTNGKGWR